MMAQSQLTFPEETRSHPYFFPHWFMEVTANGQAGTGLEPLHRTFFPKTGFRQP